MSTNKHTCGNHGVPELLYLCQQINRYMLKTQCIIAQHHYRNMLLAPNWFLNVQNMSLLMCLYKLLDILCQTHVSHLAPNFQEDDHNISSTQVHICLPESGCWRCFMFQAIMRNVLQNAPQIRGWYFVGNSSFLCRTLCYNMSDNKTKRTKHFVLQTKMLATDFARLILFVSAFVVDSCNGTKNDKKQNRYSNCIETRRLCLIFHVL